MGISVVLSLLLKENQWPELRGNSPNGSCFLYLAPER